MNIKDIEPYRVNDEMTKRSPSDVRKPELTLVHLNKLRKMREVQKLVDIQHRKQLHIVYGIPKEPDDSEFM